MLDVLVELHGAVLLVACAFVEAGGAALCVQTHRGGASLAGDALGLGQKKRAESAAARFGQHGQTAEHPACACVCTVLCRSEGSGQALHVRIVGVGKRSRAAYEASVRVQRQMDGRRVGVGFVELVLEPLLLYEHAFAHEPRVFEVAAFDAHRHGLPPFFSVAA